jgi:hypothetical protein
MLIVVEVVLLVSRDLHMFLYGGDMNQRPQTVGERTHDRS